MDYSTSEISARTVFLDIIANAGKPMFSVDYVDIGSGYSGQNKTRIDDYRAKALAKKYLPYAGISDRNHDELNIIGDVQSCLFLDIM